MLKNMDYVYEVYLQKSFSKAAQALFISQSSLSITIKNLEKRIGLEIFDRSTKPITLTKFGERYIRAIEEIRRITKDLEIYIDEATQHKTGSLVIGAAGFCVTYILPNLIAEFNKVYPDVSITLVEDSTSNLETKLFDGTLDFMISSKALDHKHSQSFPLYGEESLLIVPDKWVNEEKISRLAQSHPLTVFADVPYILLREGNNNRTIIDNLMRKYEINPKIMIETDQNITACAMACSGVGATIVSELITNQLCPNKPVHCFKLNDPEVHRINYISARRSDDITFLVQEFIRIAQTTFP